MTNKFACGATLTFLVLTLVGSNSLAEPTRANRMHWTEMPMDEIRMVYDRADLSDRQKVLALSQYIDRRISVSRLKQKGISAEDAAYDYAVLIRLIAVNPGAAKPLLRQEIQAVIKQLDSVSNIDNKKEVRTYLYVALSYAGGISPESQLLKLLHNPTTQAEMVHTVLEAMHRSQVPIRALPRLLELSKHPWNMLEFVTDVGPPQTPPRIYPIRTMSCNNLLKLGIRCQATRVPGKKPSQPAEQWETVIRIDRNSLVAKLQAWLLSNERKVWQAAADIAYQIPGKDVQAMLHDLLRSGKLTAQKKQALATAKKAASTKSIYTRHK